MSNKHYDGRKNYWNTSLEPREIYDIGTLDMIVGWNLIPRT